MFLLSLISFILLLCYSYIKKKDYEYQLSNQKWKIHEYRADIRMINQLIFQSDKSKRQIDSILIDYDQSDGDFFKITRDTSFLWNTSLIFKENQLISIENQY